MKTSTVPHVVPGLSVDPDSTWIVEYTYLADAELFVLVTDKQVYLFDKFPLHEYINLIRAESAGKYFNENIRDEYTFTKVSRV